MSHSTGELFINLTEQPIHLTAWKVRDVNVYKLSAKITAKLSSLWSRKNNCIIVY